jgi:hypothetical protein
MLNLEQSIAEWRRQMLAAGIKTPVVLEELEEHLREEIARQIELGVQPQTAFSKAKEKIGGAESLRRQFKLAHGVGLAKQRKFIGCFYATLLGVYVVATTYAMTKNALSNLEWCLGVTAQLTLLLLSWFCWRQLPVRFPVISNRAVQSAIGLIGGVSGAVWFLVFAYFLLPLCNFTTGELTVALLWAMVPTLLLPEAAFLLLDKSEGEELQVN